ncbi:hypothetical protein CEXT_229261 [Caerostris extrusa]|uniref:Uncharacterized protein n=1 Tax=Caerostris extrusa TaxID=172846 RepID=A0AAV4NQP8_CAEEX|nr:hypothetical protein CEXT_229261 [Caerostris extrusa]
MDIDKWYSFHKAVEIINEHRDFPQELPHRRDFAFPSKHTTAILKLTSFIFSTLELKRTGLLFSSTCLILGKGKESFRFMFTLPLGHIRKAHLRLVDRGRLCLVFS